MPGRVEMSAGMRGQPDVFDGPTLPVRQIGGRQPGKETAHIGGGIAMRSVVDLRSIAGRIGEAPVLQGNGEVDDGSRHG